MASVTASRTRTTEYTQVHRCSGCGKAFWAKPSWNAVTVVCPRCSHEN